MKRKLFSILILAYILFFAVGTSVGDAAVYAAFRNDDEAEQNASVNEEDTSVNEEDIEVEREQVMPELPDAPEMTDEYKVLESYETTWTENLFYNIQYKKYSVFPHYVVNMSSARKVYEKPDKDSDRLDKIYYGEKFQAVALVEDEEGEKWYAVVCEDDDEYAIGYVEESKVSKREFLLDEMIKYLDNISGLPEKGQIAFVKNYKYENGYAPKMPNGSYYDDFGYRRGQSAAGYYSSDLEGDFRYIPDGMIGIVEEVVEITETEEDIIIINNKGEFVSSESEDEVPYNYYDHSYSQSIRDEALDKYNENAEVMAVKLYIPSFDTSLWVEEKYLNEEEKSPEEFKQAIIVDRGNQNIVVFEYIEQWEVVSINYSTTGKVGEFSLPTPLGYYMAITKKPKFNYVEDGTSKIVGFAPYAIRFSGGGYLHGVPVNYKFDEKGSRLPATGYIEYLSSIGTKPKSHMCVRNYTSHASFMYNWVDIGSCAVIIME